MLFLPFDRWPHETVNDADGFVANWRAMKHDSDAVAESTPTTRERGGPARGICGCLASVSGSRIGCAGILTGWMPRRRLVGLK